MSMPMQATAVQPVAPVAPTIAAVSDLHIEHDFLSGLPGGAGLLICGDLVPAAVLRPQATDAMSRGIKKRFEKFCAEELCKYRFVLHISGNHEFYGGIIEDTPYIFKEWFLKHAPNTTHLSDETVVIDGVAYIGSTMWATYGYGTASEWFIQHGMNDCRAICTRHPLLMQDGTLAKFQSAFRRFFPWDAYRLHNESLVFICDAVQQAAKLTDKKCVVMTHHAPSYESRVSSYRYGSSDYDAAYYSNQDRFILDNPNIAYWLHGHTHDSVKYQIGATTVLSNSRGYPGENGHCRFAVQDGNLDLSIL